jgi:hypothetical protein
MGENKKEQQNGNEFLGGAVAVDARAPTILLLASVRGDRLHSDRISDLAVQ